MNPNGTLWLVSQAAREERIGFVICFAVQQDEDKGVPKNKETGLVMGEPEVWLALFNFQSSSLPILRIPTT